MLPLTSKELFSGERFSDGVAVRLTDTGDTTKHPGAGLQQDYYEWGGKNADGNDGFKQNRPGWPAPIHRLLVQYKVNIVFP